MAFATFNKEGGATRVAGSLPNSFRGSSTRPPGWAPRKGSCGGGICPAVRGRVHMREVEYLVPLRLVFAMFNKEGGATQSRVAGSLPNSCRGSSTRPPGWAPGKGSCGDGICPAVRGRVHMREVEHLVPVRPVSMLAASSSSRMFVIVARGHLQKKEKKEGLCGAQAVL